MVIQSTAYTSFPRVTAGSRLIPYSGPDRSSGRGSAWGKVLIVNPERGKRPQLRGAGESCPFDHHPGELLPGVVPLGGAGDGYLLRSNAYPVYERQVLVTPVDHRETLAPGDVELVLHLVRHGVGGLIPESALQGLRPAKGYVVYGNMTAGSGQSIPHRHDNAIPAEDLPLPDVAPAGWPVAQTAGGAVTLSRACGLCYYAIMVQGADEAVGEFLPRLDDQFRRTGLAYNMLAFARPERPSEARLALVPRSREFSTVAEQKVAGLEFLTGMLLPGRDPATGLTCKERDQALREVTLNHGQARRLERFLRAFAGMPAPGLAVQGESVAG